MNTSDYKELIVWRKAMLLARTIYEIVKLLPEQEQYSLSHQLRKCAVSIPSNIAEGQSRRSTKEFIQFLSIANGSRAEAETQLRLCVMLNYCKEDDIAEAIKLLEEISKMIASLQQSLSNKSSSC